MSRNQASGCGVCLGLDDTVAESCEEGFILGPLLSMQHGVAQSPHLLLNRVGDRKSMPFPITEIGADGLLPRGNHHQYIPDSASGQLLNNVLEHRLAAERQHLLWNRQREWAQACAVAGRGD